MEIQNFVIVNYFNNHLNTLDEGYLNHLIHLFFLSDKENNEKLVHRKNISSSLENHYGWTAERILYLGTE